MSKAGTKKNRSMLIAKKSELVDVLVACILCDSDPTQKIITIDSTNLVRACKLPKQKILLSYKINISDVVTACTVDSANKYMAVGSESGEA